jgi:hypothetical protein
MVRLGPADIARLRAVVTHSKLLAGVAGSKDWCPPGWRPGLTADLGTVPIRGCIPLRAA